MNRIVIQCLPSAAGAAARVATRLGVAMHEMEVHRFPDGELRITTGPAAPVTVIYAPFDRPNENLLSVLFATEALRRGGANRIVLMAPYLCYMRQDTAFHKGEAISQKVIGGLIAQAVDRVISVDAHLHRTKNLTEVFPGIPADNLSAMPAIADYLKAAGFEPDTVVAGPDAESEPWVRELARFLNADYAVAQKTRHGDRSVEVVFSDRAIFSGRPVLLVDDIVSSGGTILACAKQLREAGAKTIDAIITHALFPVELTATLLTGGFRSIHSTDSVPHSTNAIELDAILAEALRTELTGADFRGLSS